MGRLTEAKIRSISKAGRYGDGDCLFLNVTKANTKSWVVRLKIRNGARRDLGIGPHALLSLKEARLRAWEYRKQAFNGHDPLAERQHATLPTFEEVAKRYYEENKPRWKAGRHRERWLDVLKLYALPKIGKTPVDRLGREDVLKVLMPIWSHKPESGRKLRQRIRLILEWCQGHGYIDGNPAGEVINGALPAMPAVKEHHRALPYEQVPEALEKIAGCRSALSVKLCLRFLILTASRSSEARQGTWSEIDVEKALWVIPPSRMKTQHEHRVPLSDEAMRVLERARAVDDGSGLLFPSPRKKGEAFSYMTMAKLLDTAGLLEKTVVHGFRSSFRDWAEEQTSCDYAVKEQALAHAVGSSIERAYTRTDLLAKRRRLMQQWSDYVTRAPRQQIVSLHR